MSQLLQLFIWIPLLGFIVSTLIPKQKESTLALVAITTAGMQLLGIFLFIIYWLINNHTSLDVKHMVVFQTEDIEIFIAYYFDKTTAVFALVGAIIFFLVSIFSRYYLHREAGYKRFFNLNLLFFLGFNIIVFAGNFETLFTGWEFLGISSFLLIAFFRDRYLPVKNGLKVISVYRLSDICLILAMWMSHHLWHENITFMELNDAQLVAAHLLDHNWYAFFISFTIVVAALIKSAQLPFSSWLPRAMEGPTSSSAIFYGSLSVHIGVFLLIRTYPYWESFTLIKSLIILTGIITSIISISISKVQSSVKTQIAYSSIAQIGLIFVEVALGFHSLALIHFAGNAFLRTYQLLVSPSVLSYLTHDMFFNFKPKIATPLQPFQNKIRNTIYILSIKEWNMDTMMKAVLWTPFKWVGKRMVFLTTKPAVLILSLLFMTGIYCELLQENIPVILFSILPIFYSLIGLLLILRAFSERGDAFWAWSHIVGGQLFIALSIALLNENFGHNHILIYLSGTLASALIGFICLHRIKAIDQNISLNQYHGYGYEQPKIGFIFLIACLGMIGLPFTPTFIGIDILFSHIHKHEELLIISTALSFVFLELAILRIYARIFMGPHKKTSHAMAYRSS